MKKFLVILMVVAMASFLFVGCLGVTPPIPPVENKPPEIISSAVTSGKVGEFYTYNVDATDPDEDVLTYSLTEKPLGMSIVPTTGIIGWIPTDTGVFGVGVKVSDPDGLFDVQSFSVTIAAADEPEPEPELVLVGIAVDPKTMDLYAGEIKEITSVTATYEVKGFETDIALEDCIFLTSDLDVATVSNVGFVEAVAKGTANILVSYGGKFDTLEVTVTTPMEITVDMPLFTEGELKEFTVGFVANDDAGKNVLVYFKLPAGSYTLYYWEVEDPAVWTPLSPPAGPGDEVAFGTSGGFPLADATTRFNAKFTTAGTYLTTIEVWTVTGEPGAENKLALLGTKDITAVVIAP